MGLDRRHELNTRPMLQVCRALIVDDDPAFVQGVTSCLCEGVREIAVRTERDLDGALRALDDYRPHIMFLNWSLGDNGRRAGELLSQMSSLMDRDPSSYDYPILINTGWKADFQKDWEEQGILFQMENSWSVFDKTQWSAWCPGVVNIVGKKMRPLRMLRRTHGTVDLLRCTHLRISDGPSLLHAQVAGQREPETLRRHRAENFDFISEQIVIPRQNDDVRALPSLFVKSNQRNAWVNLAYVKNIGYADDGEFAFVFYDSLAAPVKLSKTIAHVANQRLEMLRQWKYWPQLAALCLPE